MVQASFVVDNVDNVIVMDEAKVANPAQRQRHEIGR
jgi:hypothetical protein